MNKKLLKKLYEIHALSGHEKKMRRFVMNYARQCGKIAMTVDEFGNLFITKGISETYPCLAAHLDQVQHSHAKDFTAIECGEGIIFGYSPRQRTQQGLGADDKNGIFICLECLKKYDVLKLAFFVGEETGCVGSSQCDLEFFKDCRFIIEPDRRGAHDLITSMFCGEVCSQEFINAIAAERFGYREEQGSITDVGELVERGVGISCLNLSCGYYEAHSDHEHTVLADLQNCLEFVQNIIETCTDVYPFVYEWRLSSYGKYDDRYGYGVYDLRDDDYEEWGYGEDFEEMYNLVRYNYISSFDEIEMLYKQNFVTSDISSLKNIYEDVVQYISEEKRELAEKAETYN